MKKLILFILLSGCALPSIGGDKFPSKVIWGRYCGECVDNCSTMREIVDSTLNIDRTFNFLMSNPNKFNYKFKGVPEPVDEYEKYKWILNEPVPEIINKAQMIFGDPDSYDQCGYYLMFSVNSQESRVLIDTEKVPKELEPIIKKLFHETL